MASPSDINNNKQLQQTPPSSSNTLSSFGNKDETSSPLPLGSSDEGESFLNEAFQNLSSEEITSFLMAYQLSYEDLEESSSDEEGEDEESSSKTQNQNDVDQPKQQKRKSHHVTFSLNPLQTGFAELSSTEFEQAQANAENFFKNHDTDFLEEAARKFESFEYAIVEEIEKQESEEQEQPQEEEETEEQEQDQEEQMMMGQRTKSVFDSFSRANSDIGEDSEDWILERISYSRKVPISKLEAGVDFDEDDLDDIDDHVLDDYESNMRGAQLTKKLAGPKTIVQFLCHWKFYAEPTWESRAVLERHGFGEEVVKYEVEERKRKQDRIAQAKLGGKVIDPNSKYARFLNRNSKYRKTVFEEIFPDWKEFIVSKCEEGNLVVKSICNIAPAFASAQFLRHWKEIREQFKNQPGGAKFPFRTFHGTRSQWVPSIITNGLLVPGTFSDVQVRNANVYNAGVYTSTRTSTPANYTCQHRLMFCCVVLTGKEYETAISDQLRAGIRQPPSHFVIIRENRLIVPVWLIHFDYSSSYHYGHRSSNVTDREAARQRANQSIQLFGDWREMVAQIETMPKSHLQKAEASVQVHYPQADPKDVDVLNPRLANGGKTVSKAALQKFIKARLGTKYIEHRSTKMMRQLPKAMKDLVMENFRKEKTINNNDKNDKK